MIIFPNIESEDRVHPETLPQVIKVVIYAVLCYLLMGCDTSTGQNTKQGSTQRESVENPVITKNALLDYIQATINLFSKQKYDRRSFDILVDSIRKAYLVKIYKPGSNAERSNALGIFIGLNESDDMFDEVDFFLPEALADDLKYTDLSKRFGPWEKETDRFPRPKNMRPVIFKLAKATNIKTIQMQVRSDNSPEMTPNKIWKIEIVQTSKLLKDKGL